LGLLPGGEVGASTAINIMLAILGALGGVVAGLRAAANHLGRGDFSVNWAAWYLIRPFVGGFTALLLWWAIVAGLLGVTASGDSLNAYGVAILAGLSGLFSKKALAKLSDVFDTVFERNDDHRGQLLTLREDLDQLAQLHRQSQIDDDEYEALKAKVLGRFEA
jgi:hypothetical protein